MGQDSKLEHRLAAIMATDVVGYSRLIQSDEAGTLAALGAIRAAIENQISQYRGRIANTAGDSVLAEFASAVEAVGCAIAVQQVLAERSETEGNFQVRIGIHMGDVVSKNGDLFGMAVNVAARLEGIAQPGGIVVSSAIREDVVGKLPASFADLGIKTLKNIEQPFRVYSLSATSGTGSSTRRGNNLPLPEKPSIAVLPFENLSSDREQEYFADGIVEEIITALSRFRGLFVIARNSSFAYKGRAIDVKQIGRELGVRYILEGSIRKAGSKVRITGQLIDASSGAHLWADRFEGTLDDIFDLQDQVTASVVGAISPSLEKAEIERARRKPTESLDAYDYFLRGLGAFHQWTSDANYEALSLFQQAIKLDPTFATAYGMAALCYEQRKGNGWMIDRAGEVAETARLVRMASELGKDDAAALNAAGMALAYVVGDVDHGAALIDQSLSLNANLAAAWHQSGWMSIYRGNPEVALERFSRAIRLSPRDLYVFDIQMGTACAHFFTGRYAEAVSWAEAAVRQQPNSCPALRTLAASSAMAGRQEQAEKAITHLRVLDPGLRISNLRDLFPLQQREDAARWEEALRLAGLPE
jgi:TolB-like protein/class 3 adenylate cyclase/tetratricopeptide (TPR) repeat protein